MSNTATVRKLPKVLNLAIGCMGGHPHFYATNVKQGGDYATIGYFVGEPTKVKEIHIELYRDFNTPAYLEQAKAVLLAKNPDLVFANDQKSGAFIDPKKVIETAKERYSLMSFEEEAILINPQKLHELYLAAKPQKLDTLPRCYDYEAMNSLYPVIQVFSALTKLIHG